MEEKVLIKSERYHLKIIYISLILIGAIISGIIFSSLVSDGIDDYDNYWYPKYLEHQENGSCDSYCGPCRIVNDYPSAFSYALSTTFTECFLIWIAPFAGCLLLTGLIYLWLHSYELTITDKRIFGKVAWGKRVDLPIDSVSATSTSRFLKGVSVSTSSGKIGFLAIKNADAIYEKMSQLLIERQQGKTTSEEQNMQSHDEADQLKKFKDLLDNGVITQEEFDAKKKQLLGL